MANLDTLEQEVDDLDTLASSIFRFREVSKHIEEAAKATTNTNVARLLSIVNDFRVKIPNLVAHNRIRVAANDIAHDLLLGTLDERIERINLRNQEITNLTTALQVEINKGNADAGLLRQIKNAVDKATATVSEIRNLIEQLTDTNVSTKNKLKAMVNTVAGLSSIFEPQNA